MRRVVAVVAALFISACAGSNVHFVPPPLPPDNNALGPNDVFALRVYGEQELSQDYRVSPDGTIDVPFVGRVRVEGMTTPQIADRIREALLDGHILVRPQVSVMIREFNSRRISVLGQVQHPGSFPFEQNMNIVQAISLAGGFTPIANHSVHLIRRTGVGTASASYVVPIDQITEARVPNVRLAPGDVISVSEGIL